mmetsp:Transcript_6168/g.15255  ORF Transcript_6168/g.15255 Transcript_6168/m.15255 type:complete len:144 (-) Transcript_6168:64-495(-)
MTLVTSFSCSPSLSLSQYVTLVDRGEIPLSAVEKGDNRDPVELGGDVDVPPEELKDLFMENAEAIANGNFLSRRETESPEDGEQNNTVVVVAAAVATAVDQIVLRFICMQTRHLEIITSCLYCLSTSFSTSFVYLKFEKVSSA